MSTEIIVFNTILILFGVMILSTLLAIYDKLYNKQSQSIYYLMCMMWIVLVVMMAFEKAGI